MPLGMNKIDTTPGGWLPSRRLNDAPRTPSGHLSGVGVACLPAADGSSLARAAASPPSAFGHPVGVLPAPGPASPVAVPPCSGDCVGKLLSGAAARGAGSRPSWPGTDASYGASALLPVVPE